MPNIRRKYVAAHRPSVARLIPRPGSSRTVRQARCSRTNGVAAMQFGTRGRRADTGRRLPTLEPAGEWVTVLMGSLLGTNGQRDRKTWRGRAGVRPGAGVARRVQALRAAAFLALRMALCLRSSA